jgi:hypothetical protein
MPKLRKNDSFYMVIIDEDNHTFSVVGPLLDDRGVTNSVCELQQAGRNVRCFSHNGSRISAMESQRGYRYVDNLFATSSEDNMVGYGGPLPGYARTANRNRVVRIMCRECGRTRWAEMDVDYPGEAVLRNSQANDFRARCLSCGKEANDSYNWYR